MKLHIRFGVWGHLFSENSSTFKIFIWSFSTFSSQTSKCPKQLLSRKYAKTDLFSNVLFSQKWMFSFPQISSISTFLGLPTGTSIDRLNYMYLRGIPHPKPPSATVLFVLEAPFVLRMTNTHLRAWRDDERCAQIFRKYFDLQDLTRFEAMSTG